jgi:hypothetical protein
MQVDMLTASLSPASSVRVVVLRISYSNSFTFFIGVVLQVFGMLVSERVIVMGSIPATVKTIVCHSMSIDRFISVRKHS